MQKDTAEAIRQARVPGSELAKRVFYESITNFKPAEAHGCPHGCTLANTQQGVYVVDHVKRTAYPFTAATTVAHESSNSQDQQDEEPAMGQRASDDASLHLQLIRQQHMNEIAAKNKVIHSSENSIFQKRNEIKMLLERVEKLQEALQVEKAKSAAMERQLHATLLKPESDTRGESAVALPVARLTDAVPANPTAAAAAVAKSINDNNDNKPGSSVPCMSEPRTRSRSRERRTRRKRSPSARRGSAEKKGSRVIRYGDSRIGVADDSSSTSSTFSSASSTSSDFSSEASSRSSLSVSASDRERAARSRRRGRDAEQHWASDRQRRESYRSAATRRGADPTPNLNKSAMASTAGREWTTAPAPLRTEADDAYDDPTASPASLPKRPNEENAVINNNRNSSNMTDRQETQVLPAPISSSSSRPIKTTTTSADDCDAGDSSGHENESAPWNHVSHNSPTDTAPQQGDRDELVVVGLTHNLSPNVADSPEQPAPPRSKAKSTATLPAKTLSSHRGATLYCKLCRTFFAPHPVNLRQHVLSGNHQRICAQVDAYILSPLYQPNSRRRSSSSSSESSEKEPDADPRLAPVTEDTVMWHRDSAEKDMGPTIKGRHATNRSEFGKVTLNLPAFIVPKGVSSHEERRAARHAQNSFFDEGIDVVMSHCDFCGDPVSVQNYKRHESTPRHQEMLPRHHDRK